MKNHFNVLLISFAVIISALFLADAYKNRSRTHDLINVTGLGKKDFVSDLIVWSGSFTRKTVKLKTAYDQLKKDKEVVKDYLIAKGLSEKEMVFSSVRIDKQFDYSYDSTGKSHRKFTGYLLTQKVEIESSEVDKIEALSREVTELINKGVEFNSSHPRYYYTQLAALKLEMIASATKDATLRAEKIAENAGAATGKLRYAKMGVFQIVAQNSSEAYTWGGAFNTSSKRKTASITMKLQFGIQ